MKKVDKTKVMIFVPLILILWKFSAGLILPDSPKRGDELNNIANNVCSQPGINSESQYFLEFIKSKLTNEQNIKSPYSGFRVFRLFTLNVFPPAINNDIHIVLCQNGVPIWKSVQPLREDIDWGAPICLVDTLGENKEENIIRKKEAIANVNNYHCFKFARSLNYYQRDHSFYFPGSTIGGLFFCDLTNTQKYLTLNNSRDDLTIINKSIAKSICSTNNSIPLLPIIADNIARTKTIWTVGDISRYFKEYKSYKIYKLVPYLHTVNIPHFRYRDTQKVKYWSMRKLIPSMLLDTKSFIESLNSNSSVWFDEIQVNEQYNANLRTSHISNIRNLVINCIGKYGSLPRSHLQKLLANN